MTSDSAKNTSLLPKDYRQETLTSQTRVFPKISFVYCPQPT